VFSQCKRIELIAIPRKADLHTEGMLPIMLTLASGTCDLRRARPGDLRAIIGLLSDDAISAARGDSGSEADWPAYERAFAAIEADSAQQLLVATLDDVVVGTMQLTVIPGLARVGASRLQIEAVRVRADRRNLGIGAAMIRWAVDQAPSLGAALVQLTSDAARVDAHRFYERLGFTASHVGFKLAVTPVR
jgi:GNAT superfamily N-acetyltransferase